MVRKSGTFRPASAAPPLLQRLWVRFVANFHAVSGVMKAVWDFRECRRMTLQPLMFTATDILLISQGLEDRAGFRPARQHAPPVAIAAAQ